MKIFLILISLVIISPSILSADSGYIEITAPGNRQLKLAVETPNASAASDPTVAKEIRDVIVFDMNMAGVLLAEGVERSSKSFPVSATDFAPLAKGGFDLVAISKYSISGDTLTVECRLYDLTANKLVASKRSIGKKRELRKFAHLFSDEILLKMTGEKGSFTTHIAFITSQDGHKEVAIMDWDGYNLLPLTKNRSINLNPSFSPDGREILFTSYKRGNPDLYKRALSNTAEILISNRSGLNITGAWSPNGSKIALALSKDGNSEIYTIDRNGGNPVRLTNNPAIEVSPVWSPDGSKIAFVSDRLGKPQIFVMPSNGGSAKRLTTSGVYNVNPSWSPKGDKIAYASMQGGFQIHVINIDGSDDTQLTNSGSNENPAWSADGRLIAFSSKRSGSSGIYVMRADGSGQTKISKGKGRETQPAWSH